MTEHVDERAVWARICAESPRISIEAHAYGLGEKFAQLRADLLAGGSTVDDWHQLVEILERCKELEDDYLSKGGGTSRRRMLADDDGGYVCPVGRCSRREAWTPVTGVPKCGLLALHMAEI